MYSVLYARVGFGGVSTTYHIVVCKYTLSSYCTSQQDDRCCLVSGVWLIYLLSVPRYLGPRYDGCTIDRYDILIYE